MTRTLPAIFVTAALGAAILCAGCSPRASLPSPSAKTAKQEHDERLAWLKTEVGDVSRATNFRFHIAFPDERSCGAARAAAIDGGYEVDAYKSPETDYWTCTLGKAMLPPSPEFEKSVGFARDLANRFGGVYIGSE